MTTLASLEIGGDVTPTAVKISEIKAELTDLVLTLALADLDFVRKPSQALAHAVAAGAQLRRDGVEFPFGFARHLLRVRRE